MLGQNYAGDSKRLHGRQGGRHQFVSVRPPFVAAVKGVLSRGSVHASDIQPSWSFLLAHPVVADAVETLYVWI